MKRKNHLAPWRLLPPLADTCQACAVIHVPEHPHNQQSLFYQYQFYGEHGRWPTWADAMAHCSPEIKARWTEELAKREVKVEQGAGRKEQGAEL